ncbi:MAG: bifunctional 3-phosphoshikimate 1-carboxyvinyltransferase/cytidylate kinase, partial [Candidatus Accumulibacter sp.]|nr:bifunctional 3-phosphoshikimate 1-carboxyvinyltransferase/cytidylate kinase [Accumulibacter sp.]
MSATIRLSPMNTPEFIDLPEILSAHGNIRLPGSKSISNRILLLAALAKGDTEIHGLLESDDTAYMRKALRQLGVEMTPLDNNVWRVQGIGGMFPVGKAELFLGNAGTALRSLCAVLALGDGEREYQLS